jgi:hypothetical protein
MHTARAFILFLGAILLALALPAAAGATPSTGVTIQTHVFFQPPGSYGSFTSAAPLCPSGTFTSPYPKAVGGALAGGDTTTFTVTDVKYFTCDDGSGTFDIQFHPKGDLTSFAIPGAQFGPTPWVVLSGTGKYSNMHGTGDFTAVFTIPPPLAEGSETLTGEVHFD